ncbi:DUF6585 family protein [Actinoallomurus rhizosphaericola]|uniref:DUF6585 family protein n=1 Tax=Actinoallomurus rhizosphaericola TaxID=2952536 RepID=UPI002091C88D|nr:DUF6585 family protein [Actinoallomurus rhizosphaericola]MCO5993202.1 hypothetical protein [Actinoallomurus rhizosphaericola]
MADLPARVRRAAEDARLGEFRAVYRPRSADRRSRTWLVLLGLPGLVLLPFAVAFLLDGFGWASGLSLLLTAAYLGAAGRVLVREVLPGQSPTTVHLFENGVVLSSWRAVTPFAWDAVTELRVSGVRSAATGVATWHLTLSGRAGTEGEALIDGDVPGARELVETVSREVTERVLPTYLSRVEAGGKVRLGPFSVTRRGIAKDGEHVPWENVDRVEIEGGMVHVDRSDRPAGLTAIAAEVPNAVAFGELTRRLRGDARADGNGGRSVRSMNG